MEKHQACFLFQNQKKKKKCSVSTILSTSLRALTLRYAREVQRGSLSITQVGNLCLLQLTVYMQFGLELGSDLSVWPKPLEDQKLRRPLVLHPHSPGGRAGPFSPCRAPPDLPPPLLWPASHSDSGDLTGQAVKCLQTDPPDPSSSSLPRSGILGASDLPLSHSASPQCLSFTAGSVCSHLSPYASLESVRPSPGKRSLVPHPCLDPHPRGSARMPSAQSLPAPR